jgi:hypothetical protein
MQLLFLQIPEFPTPQGLWVILAETRRLRRNGRDRKSFGNHSPTVKELKSHEIKVINLLAKMGMTV